MLSGLKEGVASRWKLDVAKNFRTQQITVTVLRGPNQAQVASRAMG